jgi:hypothetical protein
MQALMAIAEGALVLRGPVEAAAVHVEVVAP